MTNKEKCDDCLTCYFNSNKKWTFRICEYCMEVAIKTGEFPRYKNILGSTKETVSEKQ